MRGRGRSGAEGAGRVWGPVEGAGPGEPGRGLRGRAKVGRRRSTLCESRQVRGAKPRLESPLVLGVPPRSRSGAYTLGRTSARSPVTGRRAEGRKVEISLSIPDPILGGKRGKGVVASVEF